MIQKLVQTLCSSIVVMKVWGGFSAHSEVITLLVDYPYSGAMMIGGADNSGGSPLHQWTSLAHLELTRGCRF